ncbi:MAG: aspartate aminotransferase family protein [Candidatus Omnitrophica bacterium]|nr:aspartate aminotransferase family protein [Candidatus Omnitrophota bacterium]
MKQEEIFQSYKQYIMGTYTRTPLIFTKGKGSKLIDINGKEYLDFFPGWGVNNLGHCHPKVIAAVKDQIKKLTFIPNNFYHINQAKLAQEINFWSFDSKVFFCNSGAEANEAAIKFSRVYGKGKRSQIISFYNSFHGRTFGALSATGQEKYKKGFQPLLAGFKFVEFNNLEAVKNALTEDTVAIMLELIQGEGGINVAGKEFIKDLRRLCDEKKLLLIIDEVQTGMGRTGEMFCFKHYAVTPDIMTLAKSLGGGLPIGAMLVARPIADILKPGMHASTFGGSPLVSKAALAVFSAIQKEKMLSNAKKMGEYLFERLNELKSKFKIIKDIRGLGLMCGVELEIEGKPIVDFCLTQGLIINCTQGKVLRLMPALNIDKKKIDKALRILKCALEKQ